MPSFDALLLFALASVVLILSPGPDSLLVSLRSASGRVGDGLRVGLGVAAGVLAHTLGVMVGIAALLKASAVAFMVVKYLGAAYLVYLGIRAFFEPKHESTPCAPKRTALFWQGFMTNVLNPKVALFFIAFLPQFVDHTRPLGAQFFTLGVVYALLSLVWMSALAYLVAKSTLWMGLKQKGGRWFRYGTGLVFIGLGLRLACKEA
jgi:threonine/homoserine/homoserine lactone efflux protein